LQLQTGGTTALTVTSAQNVGSGTTSPAYKLDTTGAVRLSGTGYNATTSPSVILTNTTASTGRIFILNSFNAGGFQIADDTGGLGATRLQIDSVGNATFNSSISVGGATPSTTGAGLTFPATQSASSDANTLDDYEEGTWTPTLGGTGTSPTCSYNQQNGTYTKIGNIVTINFNLYTNSISGGGGSILVKSLPFACSSNGTDVGTAWTYNLTLSTGFPMAFRFNGANTELLIEVMRSGNNPLALSISDWPTASIALVRGNLTYRVA